MALYNIRNVYRWIIPSLIIKSRITSPFVLRCLSELLPVLLCLLGHIKALDHIQISPMEKKLRLMMPYFDALLVCW